MQQVVRRLVHVKVPESLVSTSLSDPPPGDICQGMVWATLRQVRPKARQQIQPDPTFQQPDETVKCFCECWCPHPATP